MPTNQSELLRIGALGSVPLEAMHIFSERATGFTRVADWITEGQLLLASVSIMGSCSLAELLWLVRALVYDLSECGKSWAYTAHARMHVCVFASSMGWYIHIHKVVFS